MYQRCLEDLLTENKLWEIYEQSRETQVSRNLKMPFVSVFIGRRDSSSSKGSTKHSDDAKRDR